MYSWPVVNERRLGTVGASGWLLVFDAKGRWRAAVASGAPENESRLQEQVGHWLPFCCLLARILSGVK